MRLFSKIVLIAVGLVALLSPGLPQRTFAQGVDQFWLDGPYIVTGTGSGQFLTYEFEVPPIADNVIVGWGFNNYTKSGGSSDRRLKLTCVTAPCLFLHGSSHTYNFNTTYCSTGILSGIYRPNCTLLFPGYTNSPLGNTGTVPRSGGPYYAAIQQEDFNGRAETRTFRLEAYIIRYGIPPLNAAFDPIPPQGPAPLTVEFENLSTPEALITSYAWDFGDGIGTSTEKDPTYTFTECQAYVVRLTITGPGGSTDFYEDVVTATCGVVDRPRPLKFADEQPDYRLFDSSVLVQNAVAAARDFLPVLAKSGVYTIHAVSKEPGAYVHAISQGVVKSIVPLTWDQCASLGRVSLVQNELEDTILIHVEPNTSDTPYCNTQLPILGPDQADPEVSYFEFYYFDVREVYVVTVAYGPFDLIYVVKDAPLYLNVGDSLEEECVLGKTVALTDAPTASPTFLDNLVSGQYASQILELVGGILPGQWGQFWIGLQGFILELQPPISQINAGAPYGLAWIGLYEREIIPVEDEDPIIGDFQEIALLPSIGPRYPTEDNFCNSKSEYSECVNHNPRMMAAGEGWQTIGGLVEWRNPGVVLDPGESVYQTLNLNPSEGYSLTAMAQPVGADAFGAAEMRLFIGLTSANGMSLTVPEWKDYTLQPSIHEPDSGLFYSAGVQNTGTVPIEIRFICVGSGNPDLAPSSCYFTNPSFDFGTTGWIASSNVLSTDGAVVLQLDDTLSQNVQLFPNEDASAHTYRGYIIYQGYFTPGEADPSGVAYTMQVEWPSGAGFTNIGPVNPDPRTMNNVYFEFEVAAAATGLFTIHPNITGGNSTFVGVRVFEVCIAGPFPQQSGGGGEAPPFTAKCAQPTAPQGNDIGPWITWHWQNLDKFYSCDLMVLLNKFYKRMDEFISLVSWQMRYWQSVALMYSRWLTTDLFPWLNGHFANMAGRTTTVNETCNNIFCVLTGLIDGILSPIVQTILGILTQAANLFFTIVTALLSLFISLIGQIFGLFHWLGDLFGLFVSAWNNSTPQTIPGLPTCAADPRSSAFCVVLWVMENTIFAGTIGSLIIPLIIGIGSAHLILYIVGDIKKTLLQLGEVS